jgi:hypothetical protein
MNGAAVPRILWLPVAIALVVQAWLTIATTPEIAFDSASYIAQAESLAADGTARNARGEPDTVRTPGYPLFVAAFLAGGLGLAGAVAAQRLIWIAVVAGVTLWTYQLTRRRLPSIVAGLIVAVDLPALQGSGSVLTETLGAVFVTLGVWQALAAKQSGSTGRAVLAGLLAGWAAFVRPVAILLGVAMAIATAAVDRRRASVIVAATIAVGSLMIPAAWTARNYAATGVATFSSIGSINLLLFRAAGSLAMRDPGGVDANLPRRQAELEAMACREAEATYSRPCDDIPMTLRASLYGGLAIPIIVGEPIGTVMQAGRALVMILFGGGANMMARVIGIGEPAARMIAFAYTVPLFVLSLIGIAYWRRIDRGIALMIVLSIGYMLLMSLGTEAYSRFRVPILPLYAMLAGGGADALWSRWRAAA